MSTSSFESEPYQPDSTLNTAIRRVGAPVVAALAFMGSSGEAKGHTAEGSYGPTPIEAVGAHPADLAPADTLAESLEQPSALTPEQYNFAQNVLNRVNNGPPEMNVIESGGMILMPGTQVYKAPMKGAIDHVIDKKHVEFWSLYRLINVGSDTYAAAREYYDQNGRPQVWFGEEWATSPKYTWWVKISQAQKIKGFAHYEMLNPKTLKSWKLPHVYAIRPDDQDNIMITQPHPPELSNPIDLATFTSNNRALFRKNGMQFSPNGLAYRRTSRPVRFEKAKLSH